MNITGEKVCKIVFVFEDSYMAQVNTLPEAIAFSIFIRHFNRDVSTSLSNTAFRVWMQTPDTPSIERVAEVMTLGLQSSQNNFEDLDSACKYIKKHYKTAL